MFASDVGACRFAVIHQARCLVSLSTRSEITSRQRGCKRFIRNRGFLAEKNAFSRPHYVR